MKTVWIYQILLFFLGVALVLGDNSRFVDFLNLYLLIFLVISAVSFRKSLESLKRHHVLLLVSCFYTISILVSTVVNLGGQGSLTTVITSIVFFAILARYIDQGSVSLAFYYGISFGLAANAIIAYSGIGIDGIELYESFRFAGTPEKSTILASILAIWVMFSIVNLVSQNVQNGLVFSLALALLPMVFLSGSKKGLLVIIPLLVWVAFRMLGRRRLLDSLYLLLGLGLTVVLWQYFINSDLKFGDLYVSQALEKTFTRAQIFATATAEDDSTFGRLQILKNAMLEFSRSPFFGIGENGLVDKYGYYAHNDLADVLVVIYIIRRRQCTLSPYRALDFLAQR